MLYFGVHSGSTAEPPTGPGPEFAAQFKASYRVLWLIAMGVVRDAALAEDVVQEAAIIALGKQDQFEPGSNFAAWMGQMVRYVAMNQFRKERKRRAAPLEETIAAPPSSEDRVLETGGLRLLPGGRLDADQELFDDRIIQALDHLSDVARTCLLLRTVENWEYAEIAKVLEIPEGTAMSHVHRARQLLRERLSAAETGTAADKNANTDV